MKLKCSHCDSERVSIDTIHTNLVLHNIYTSHRIDRTKTKTHANHVNHLTNEHVAIVIKCKDCSEETDFWIRDDGSKVEFKDE